MRTPNNKPGRTPEAQAAVEKGEYYQLLLKRFITSFSPEKREAAKVVFQRMEADNNGWSSEVEQSARAMVNELADKNVANDMREETGNKIGGVMYASTVVPGNEASDVTELSGSSSDEEMRFSLRVEDPEKVINPDAEDTPESPDDKSLESMAKQLRDQVGQEEAEKTLSAAISRASDVQPAYEQGARGRN